MHQFPALALPVSCCKNIGAFGIVPGLRTMQPVLESLSLPLQSFLPNPHFLLLHGAVQELTWSLMQTTWTPQLIAPHWLHLNQVADYWGRQRPGSRQAWFLQQLVLTGDT